MVAGAREGTDADAVLGVVPRLVAEPRSVDEAAEALAAAARDRLRVAFVGGGTTLDLGAPPAALDLVVRTAGLARVVEHAPDDQIAVVEAGLTLGELQRRLAPHRQRLALDPPLPERATVGGIVAANAYGPRRHRHGTIRDLLLGVTFVRADGVLAKSGAKVVKNVAGFDLARLLVGSLGTLALVATATVRLHPLPEEDATVLVPALRPAALVSLGAALRRAVVDAAAVVALVEDGTAELAVRLEGFAPGVAEQRERLLAAARGAGLAPRQLADAAARAAWARHDAIRTTGGLRAKLTAPAATLPALVERGLDPLLAALDAGRAALYPTLGVAFAGGEPRDARSAADAIAGARAALAPLGGTVILTAAPPAVRALVDPWGPPPPSLALMRRLKERLDPEHRLAPGRFLGGI